ncbi:DNA polymerase ligase N-terminal domain-containing protein [Streptomyces roseoverticillatus]|uniref:DNA polymerase ligase N-terminal domain-containing protein n=1 Tax=Streptomyces roseoverticillatus TaxID=66429 RepID=UPI0006938B72|nr:DNA polymerase ligase N-terminal domain-containing protein [Streptomyces roseoverticillatus]
MTSRKSEASAGALTDYRRKRDFTKTAEPSGAGKAGGRRRAAGGQPSFVVQIHDATTTHFDFRLEADGVLKSWAVPKGPSRDPQEKRLAMPTEDHPLSYRTFEGVIAEGGYGAGTVIVWDEGTYRNETTGRDGDELPMAEALRRGHASFWMDGSKLHGGYALTRIREGRDEAWVLVKRKDKHATAAHGSTDPVRARSALTGRTLRQVARQAAAAESG